MVKSTGHSSKGPGFNSQNPHGSSQPAVALVPGDSVPPSDPCSNQTYKGCTEIHACKIPMNKRERERQREREE